METYCKELAHLWRLVSPKILQGESASWRLWWASDIVPVWRLAGLTDMKSQRFSSNPKEEKAAVLVWRQVARKNSVLLGTVGLFVLFRSSIDWGPPTLERAIGFTQSANLNLSLIPKHSHRHTHSVQSNIWTPRGPVKLTHKISHHTIFWVLEITTGLMMKYGGKSWHILHNKLQRLNR